MPFPFSLYTICTIISTTFPLISYLKPITFSLNLSSTPIPTPGYTFP